MKIKLIVEAWRNAERGRKGIEEMRLGNTHEKDMTYPAQNRKSV